MTKKMRSVATAAVIVANLVCIHPVFAVGWFGGGSAPAATVSADAIAKIQQALDEERYVDAGKLLTEASAVQADDPRLILLGGEFNLARARYGEALENFKSVETNPAVRARALQGEGIALSFLNRSNEAIAILQQAVTQDPTAARAWNALAAEFDRQRNWTQAEAAYDHALSNSSGAAQILNNRGFSRLLQRRYEEAVTDFVAALEKKPDLAPARTNLRLAIAMKGDYGRSVGNTGRDDQAALLNNAGFAAILRGDYAQAESLLDKAIKAKGEYYARASANLEFAQNLKARGGDAAGALDAAAH